MIRKTIVLAVLTACLLATGFHAVHSQDPQTPAPEPPERTEVREVRAPVRMMTEEAENLMEQLRARAIADAADVTDAETQDEATSGVTRVIRIEPVSIVNFGPHFLFSDVTDRKPVGPRLTLEQRQAQVEAIRQSLGRTKKKRTARSGPE